MYKHEVFLMQLLDWDLNKVTLLNFLDNFAVQGFLISTDRILELDSTPKITDLQSETYYGDT